MLNYSLCHRSLLFFLFMFSCLATGVFAQVSVLTQHNDNARTGANLNETILNVSNVTVNQFGKLFSRAVDGQIYAQPLYVPNVTIPNKGVHNVVYVATMNNSVYAFDADDPNASAPLWTRNFGPPVPNQDTGELVDIQPIIGITSTPVIDISTKTLYCVAKTKENNSYFNRLHALDITTGQEKTGSPVVITATIPGTGDGSVGGTITFNQLRQLNRPSLLLLNGVVYIAFGSHGDQDPYHGWVFGYDAATLQQRAVFNTSPTGSRTSIWQSGQGLAADANGNIYFMTANGSFDVNVGGKNMGSCFVKLSTPTLQLLDWFAPYNEDILNVGNHDLGSAGPLLIPGTNMLIGGGKEGVLYLLDRNNMGHFRAGDNNQILQSFQATAATSFDNGHLHGSPVYWNSPNWGPLIYLWAETDRLKAYQQMGNGLFNTTPVAVGPTVVPDGMPGAMLSISANGSSPGSGIVWASHPFSGDANLATVPGILQAFDASNVAVELWNSKQNAARDDLGNFAKYVPPTIANGKVYLATFSNQLVVYGLNPPGPPPLISNGQPTGVLPLGTTQTMLSLTTDKNATCRYATTPGVSYDLMANIFSTTGGTSHSTIVTGLTDGQVYNYYCRCSDTAGNANTSDYVISFGVGTPPQKSGLVAAYAFNEGAGGTTADASGNGNTGTLTGPAWAAQGKYGSALSFNGASFVTVNDSPTLDLTNGMTLEAWVYPTVTPTNWSTAVMKEQPGGLVYTLYAGAPTTRPNVYIFTSGEQGVAGPAALPLNTWSHLAGTYDGVTLRLYVNGTQVASQGVSGNLVTSSGAVRIGGNSVWGEYFQGLIDEVRIYNRALTGSEIQGDMNTPIGEARDTTPPVLSNGQPSGTLAAGTTQTTLSLTTDENATCKYATTAGTPYASMPTVFSTTGGTSHSTTVNGLSGGQTYNYYCRCSDALGNVNGSDYVITFSVAATPAAAPTVSSVSPASGPTSGGTSVTIAGTNFATGASVSFGGTAATTVSVVSATSITATTPAHAAGVVSVVVTNPDGQSGTLTNGFTYTTTTQTISFVQVAAATPQSPTGTVVVTYPSAQTAGDLNIVVVGWNDTAATVQSVRDSAGNTYSLAIGPTSGTGLRQSIYYAKNIVGGGNTVTVTFSQPAVYPDIRILEYRGVTTLDVTAGASGRGAAASSGSATTTAANELIFGANTVATSTTGPGTGFTSRIITVPDGDIAEDRIVTTTGSYSATAPLQGNNYWVMQMATFK
ncbi:MAG TPA: LamG-like jellyroll fold domain-containing protein [Methylomirabilota bacterium]|nr:LamG-like jellyroll fold domain-containing protein [Methylomirabilota bacterium]